MLGLSPGLFYLYRYFSVPYFELACDHGNSFLVFKRRKRRVLDRGQNGFQCEDNDSTIIDISTILVTMYYCGYVGVVVVVVVIPYDNMIGGSAW